MTGTEARSRKVRLAEYSADPTALWLAAAFVLYGLTAIAFLAINIPPFQNPDEAAHFLRAAQLADGGLVGTRFSVTAADGSRQITAGGNADPGVLAAALPFNALIFHPDARAMGTYWKPPVHWSTQRAMTSFPNTAVAPPVFYVPSALAVIVGRMSRITVIQTLLLSRVLTGLAAVSVGAVAIVWAGRGAPWVFAVLTLPMSLSLIASSSQDALLLGCSALAGAAMLRALRVPGRHDWRILAILAVSLGLIGAVRPPYGALVVLPLGLTAFPLRWRIACAAAAAACIVAWCLVALLTAATNFGAFVGAEPGAQIAAFLSDPVQAAHVVLVTLRRYWLGYVVGFVGQLGWLDTALPGAYYGVAVAMLVVAAIAAMLGVAGGPVRGGSWLAIAGAILLAAGGIFAIQYLTWTTPGSPTVEGVQGRYFLPLALAGAALLPALQTPRLACLHRALVLAVAAFPIATLTVVMRAVVLRYYLG